MNNYSSSRDLITDLTEIILVILVKRYLYVQKIISVLFFRLLFYLLSLPWQRPTRLPQRPGQAAMNSAEDAKTLVKLRAELTSVPAYKTQTLDSAALKKRRQ